MLVHHANSAIDGLAGVTKVMDYTIDKHPSVIGPIDTGEDVTQGGFARAVLAKKRVNLTP